MGWWVVVGDSELLLHNEIAKSTWSFAVNTDYFAVVEDKPVLKKSSETTYAVL